MSAEPWEDQPAVRGRSRVLAVLAVLALIVVAALAGLGAAELQHRRADSYRSQAVLLIDQEPGLTASLNDGLINKLIRLRLKYVDLVQTTSFSDPLATRLGLPAGRVRTALTATAPPSSLLVVVAADDKDREVSQRVAQAGAESLRDALAGSQAALGIPQAQQVTLTVVTPARPGSRTTPGRDRVILIGAVVAGGVLLGGLVVLDLLRRRRD